MRELLEHAINQAQLAGAHYADARLVDTTTQSVAVKNGVVESLNDSKSIGVGVRVLAGGYWGFAATNNLEKTSIAATAKLSVEIARASAVTPSERVTLAPSQAVDASYATAYEIDPFLVPLDRKIDLLLKADKLMRLRPEVVVARGFINCVKRRQSFASSEGSFIVQEIIETGTGIEATAAKDGEIERRSYPNSMGGQTCTRGYELVQELDILAHAERVGEQAVQLLSAIICPSSTTDVIIDGSQLALQVHESIGHPTELDRILGMEAAFAGTSFVTLDMLGNFKYASDIVNVVADATVPGALGTFGYDDEGVPAQRADIIKNGTLVGLLTSRETAAKVGQTSNGTNRADGWNRTPLIRMTNINLLPGQWKLDELIADTTEGIYLETNKSWSIDDKRLNFQFATEIAWEIKNGRLGAMLRKPNYSGITPEFWNSCDAICGPRHWKVWGTPNCGKGEPMQVAHVAHGTSPARFRAVKVGIGT